MRQGFCLSLLGVCLCVFGCQRHQQSWLLVNFEKDVPIAYQITSTRQITIDLTGGSSENKSRPQTISEELNLVMNYTPTDVDPFGLTTIVAECQSAKVTRSSMSGKKNEADAMEQLAGKKFTFQLSPTGQIAEYADMERLVRELGQAAFVKGKDDTQRIKNPDMISDFIALQWHLWDSTSTIEEPLEGMAPGKSWQVKQWIPWPAPTPNLPARLTTYTLDHFMSIPNDPAPQDQARKAVIKSTYVLSEGRAEDFPRPYEGNFQMRGLMGFLRNYQFLSLEGGGEQIFNMDHGFIESDQQHYMMKVNAAFMLPLGGSLPVLTIDQTISIERMNKP